ncbi:hypothetical protein WJ97_12855 [Burkholderia ubonensis]|uniref:hypothetical protein n=1 Tax=Burkholderia ubonensis TaxID=101571 RepID=UPI00075446A9|nr:hypothetical protein [Burkholderia ubonensis]KVP96763.1 hypothetical protein WJ97_12855 [Burkholderia ubonensis]
MEEQDFLEDKLQKWFEATAEQNEICSSILNLDELRYKADSLARAARTSNTISRAGLSRALRICEVLKEVTLVGANESIAPPECKQMRPDIVLVTPASQYLLVELKSKPEAERQGVQELLAYSTAIKMQAHHVNDFIYIIVAHHWNALLTYGVRSMILEGKHVLPLQCRQDATGFSLRIKLELFDFQFARPYDPWYALSPATLAVMRKVPRRTDLVSEYAGLDRYFRRIVSGALADCNRLHQSGFLMVWRYPGAPDTFGDYELVNLTLFTVNQHWMASEHAPLDCHPEVQRNLSSFDGLHLRRYNEAYDAVTALHPVPDEEDVFATTALHQEAARAAEGVYPQSTFSEDVLDRYRSLAVEGKLESNRAWFGRFELHGATPHLRSFLRGLDSWPMARWMEIKPFFPFGDMADFANTPTAPPHPKDHDELTAYIEAFRTYKVPALA